MRKKTLKWDDKNYYSSGFPPLRTFEKVPTDWRAVETDGLSEITERVINSQ